MNDNFEKEQAKNLLKKGVSAMNIIVDDHQINQLMSYLDLLKKWNKTYNLTSVTDWKDMVTIHILDSLALLPFIDGSHIADLGTGAGLPGIPLAIMFPDKQFTLVDCVGKKIRFIRQVQRLLSLSNIKTEHSRIEHLVVDQVFDVIIARALASIGTIISLSRSYLASNGYFLLMKGVIPYEELELFDNQYTVQELKIFGLDAKRHIITINNKEL